MCRIFDDKVSEQIINMIWKDDKDFIPPSPVLLCHPLKNDINTGFLLHYIPIPPKRARQFYFAFFRYVNISRTHGVSQSHFTFYTRSAFLRLSLTPLYQQDTTFDPFWHSMTKRDKKCQNAQKKIQNFKIIKMSKIEKVEIWKNKSKTSWGWNCAKLKLS